MKGLILDDQAHRESLTTNDDFAFSKHPYFSQNKKGRSLKGLSVRNDVDYLFEGTPAIGEAMWASSQGVLFNNLMDLINNLMDLIRKSE